MANILEIADGVYQISSDNYRLSSGLILGQTQALVIDTGAGPRQGQEVLDAVRSLTDLPLAVVNSHAHFDRFMGNAVFEAAGARDFWAHPRTAQAIAQRGDAQRPYVEVLEPEMAHRQGPATQLVVPNRLLAEEVNRSSFTQLDLGGRTVTLIYLGPAHTDGDVLVGVEDILFTGDIVEQGSEPAFEDSYPAFWVTALQDIAGLERYRVFVPGHGKPVDRAFVERMGQTMGQAIERLQSSALAQDSQVRTASMYQLPYSGGASRILLDRLRQLEQAEN